MARVGWLGFIWLGLCIAPAPAHGQDLAVDFGSLRRFEGVSAQSVGFDHLTIEEGLSQNAVYALLQDRAGFLWIGTKDGLNRYDGYSFAIFRHDPFDPSTLSSSYVTSLFEDSAGNLWVGTQDGGLNRLDRASGAAIRYTRSPRWRINAIAEDDAGNIWLGTAGGGAYRLASAARRSPRAGFERFVHTPGERGSLAGDQVTSIVADDGEVWLGTESGLSRLDATGETFVSFRRTPATAGGMSDDFVTALLRARDGTVWVGTPSGLQRLIDARRGRFVAYPYSMLRRGYGWGTIHRIGEGPAGRLWLATSDGLARFDPVSRTYTSFLHDPLDPRSLAGSFLRTLWWDRTGVLWLGTNGYGVDRYDLKTARFQTLRRPADPSSRQDGFSARAIFEDSRGILWISAGVLYRFDRRTGTLISFETDSRYPRDFGNTGVWSIAEDRAGGLWFGTYEGLYRYDRSSGRVRHYAHDPHRPGGLPEKIVFGVFQDRAGAMWVVTAQFISRLDDPAEGRFSVYRHTPPEINDVAEGMYPAIHEDAAGIFWLATDAGLVRFNPRTGSTRRFRPDPNDTTSLGHDQVRAITPDPRRPDRVLWIGTAGGGLNRLDLRSQTFSRVTVREGLPNNVVYAALPDRRGRLWLSTNRGIARFDPTTGAVRTFDVDDGLQSNEFNAGAYFRARDGRLFFGGIQGVTTFDPGAIVDNPHAPPIVLTGFRLAGRAQVPGAASSVLARDMSTTDTLRLSHSDNVFTFEFAALDYSAPQKNAFAYRMEGFDADWIEAGTERTATYTNLPPGRYTFHVRGANNDGVWNLRGATVAVFIAAPWWRTYWAYAAYLTLALGALLALARYRRRRLLLKHRLEIEHLEAEKLRELDRARSHFFANVSHEFRTPLTLTLGPLDDLKAGLHGPLPDAMVEQVDLARRNARRVLDLINQMLDVARLEAGRMPLHARRVDLGQFAEACVLGFASLARREGLTLDLHRSPLPVLVWADPEHMEKILVNLLSNAVKFTPAGGTVRVDVESDAATARVVVRDSGPGIPEADLPHIFDRFYRVGEASTRRQPGTGIGLALAKELVDLHGGALTVASELGFGSTFTVSLPLGRAHLTDEQAADDQSIEAWAPSVPVHAEEPGGDGIAAESSLGELADEASDVTTVLIVEDHPEVRAYVRRHLQPGYRVVEAVNGVDGLAKARELLPDLIVSDVMMPDLDGLALCGALKGDAETSFIPIILLTAKAGSDDRIEGLREHCDDYLTKPFDPAELRARIQNLIEQRRRLHERYARPIVGAPGRLALHPTEVSPTSADAAFLESVRELVEGHLADDSFSVERLAAAVGISRAHLHRRLNELLGRSPSDLVRGMRLERAAELLGARAGSVSEVAYAVGFKSVAHFSNAFRARYGCRPSAYARAGQGAEESGG